MIQAVAGAVAGTLLVAAGVRGVYVMVREEYKDYQRDLETSYKQKLKDGEIDSVDPELGECEPEFEEKETGYVDYYHDQNVRPQSPTPSVPSLVRVPAPGSHFPPPPPRSPRTSHDNVIVAQPASSSSSASSESGSCQVSPMVQAESYVEYIPFPEVSLPSAQSDLSKFVVVHPPSPAPPPVEEES